LLAARSDVVFRTNDERRTTNDEPPTTHSSKPHLQNRDIIFESSLTANGAQRRFDLRQRGQTLRGKRLAQRLGELVQRPQVPVLMAFIAVIDSSADFTPWPLTSSRNAAR
jgi:hypothetical protein